MQYRDKSMRPVVNPPQFENIPETLRQIPSWVLWKFVWLDTHWGKVPYRLPAETASVLDSNTWQSFMGVNDLYFALAGFAGAGFVFTASTGLVGIDLDECVKWEGDKPVFDDWALATIKKVGMNSYIEFSPSRTGLHIIIKGKIEKAVKYDKGGIEIYAQDRYFTITGDVYNSDEPSEAQEGLDEIIAAIERARSEGSKANKQGDGSQASKDEKGSGNPGRLLNGVGSGDSGNVHQGARKISSRSAEERVAFAFNAKNGQEIKTLFESEADDLCGYPSRSDADMALCRKLAFYSEGHLSMLVAMMILSARQRDKWFREIKSSNEPYLEYTCRRALETETKFWTPPLEVSLAKALPADYQVERPKRHTLASLIDSAIAYKYRPDILGLDCGWKNLDMVYRPRPGLLSVWIGEPGSGKSTFIFAYLYQFCLRQGLRAGLAAFEVRPVQRLLHDLVRVHLKAPTFIQMDGCVSDDEFRKAALELDPYFYVMDPGKGERNVPGLAEIIKSEKAERSQDVLYLDPFTQLQSANRLALKYTDFISDQLQTLVEETERLEMISHLVVHPTKGFNRSLGLRFSDANGSGDFERVADYGLVVTAEYVGTERRTVVHAQKIRDQFTGQADGKAAFTLDQPSYLFSNAQVPIRLGKGSELEEKGEIPF